jgi:hypothetical protein
MVRVTSSTYPAYDDDDDDDDDNDDNDDDDNGDDRRIAGPIDVRETTTTDGGIGAV